MKLRVSVPILAWVAMGLVVVAGLPFALSYYLIDRSKDSVIGQTQMTHAFVARSNAETVGAYLDLIQGSVSAAADDPDLYLEPKSEKALAVLEDLLTARPEMLSLGLFARQDGTASEVFVLRRPGVTVELSPLVASESLTMAPTYQEQNGQPLLSLQQESARPEVFLAALLDVSELRERSAPPELGESAELVIVDAEGGVIAGRADALNRLPAELVSRARQAPLRSDTHRVQGENGATVLAVARVPGVNWSVFSLQPAREIERATAEMSATARQAFLALAVVVALLLAGAHGLVIRPIRGMIAAQRRLLGGSGGGGSEIAQLQESFEQLEQALSERDSLSEVFLDRYQVVRRLGSGAMGTVYLGWDPKLHRNVALKTVKFSDDLSIEDRRELTESLLQEGVTSARLTHPNIVTVYDVMGDERSAFIAMEFVEGEGLDERLSREVRMAPRVVAEVAEGVLKGLRLAHQHNVVHRDIKPPNIMLARDGTVKVTDFGIAGLFNRQTEGDSVVMGTPGYLAPECYRTAEYGPRTDLFALGVVMVECLTGKLVFPGRNTVQIITRTSSVDVRLPDEIARHVPAGMMSLIEDLLQKDPAKRLESAEQALEYVDRFKPELMDAPEDALELEPNPLEHDRESPQTRRQTLPAATRQNLDS
ncbi:MAG: serine/threonine protein kinase [Xanthomonadales bacterium]|nr:serine/threonine protein kinase [Xanthomonadales bacterium]